MNRYRQEYGDKRLRVELRLDGKLKARCQVRYLMIEECGPRVAVPPVAHLAAIREVNSDKLNSIRCKGDTRKVAILGYDTLRHMSDSHCIAG